jgi:multidrug efflux pump subunit AcrA (membrane-fusion protein)
VLKAYIPEADLSRVKWGQEVSVTTDLKPQKIYKGKISFISSQAEFTPKQIQTEKERVTLVYRIKIDIPNPEKELKPGMVDAIFDAFYPLRWCLFVEPVQVYRGRKAKIEAVLANEDMLAPGEYPARLKVVGPATPRSSIGRSRSRFPIRRGSRSRASRCRFSRKRSRSTLRRGSTVSWPRS